MHAIQAIRARLADESGFGIVEALTASIVLAVGLVGGLVAFDAAKKGSHTAQRHEQMIAYAQGEIERIKAQPFALIELDAVPPAMTEAVDDPNNPSDPRAFAVDTNGDGAKDSLEILRSYHNRALRSPGQDPAEPPPNDPPLTEPFIVDPNPEVDKDPKTDQPLSPVVSVPPFSENVAIGPPSPNGAQTTADVYRFVTVRDEDHQVLRGDGTPYTFCETPAPRQSKRITVAVRLNEVGNGTGPHKPVYVSSLVTDPEAEPLCLPD